MWLHIAAAHKVLCCCGFFRYATAMVEKLLPEFGERQAARGSQQQALLANPTPLAMAAIGFLIVYLPFVQLSRALELRVGAK